jgi:ATP-dependent Clp protease ATP-binding subunit ClpA
MRNVLLVGHPGVGKTATINGLARLLLNRDPSLSPAVRNLDLFQLDPAFPRCGASGVADMGGGQELARLQTLLRQLPEHPNLVLVIDNFLSFLHLLYRLSVQRELNDSFKSALSQGSIICLGCASPPELTWMKEQHDSLLRYFRVIHLPPPNEEEVVALLRGLQPRLEIHFNPLRIPDTLLPRVVTLADQYLQDRFQPEKSIRLLESACARAVLDRPAAVEVSTSHLYGALEDQVGPVIVPGRLPSVSEVVNQLKAAIVGQDAILEPLARAFVSSRVENGWYLRQGPRGVFLFGGPTGVGKTETAVRLARILGGGHEALVRVDCQNFQGSGTGQEANSLIWRLLGVAPGYVGYQPGCKNGLLAKVREFPESILLFDEFEKADPAVGKLLLRILDEGKAQDSEGHELDFRRCFVVLTTNAGVTYPSEKDGTMILSEIGRNAPAIPSVTEESLRQQLLQTGLGQEFLGRIQQLFLFRGLEKADTQEILERQLQALRDFASGRRLRLSWTSKLVDRVLEEWRPGHDVRHLQNLLRSRVLDQLNLATLEGRLTEEVEEIILDVGTKGPSYVREGRKLTIYFVDSRGRA